MIRLMKADIYRLLHTKGFFATGLAVMAYAIIQVITETSGGVGINQDLMSPAGADLKSAVNAAIFSSSILVYIFIGLFVMIIGYEFSQKNYKNSLTAGLSRFQFVFAKYLSEVIYLTLFILIYFLTVIVTAYVKFGNTQSDFLSLIMEVLFLAVAFGLLISVVFSLATMLLISMGSLIVGSVFIVFYPLIIQIAYSLTSWEQLKYFDFLGFVQILATGQLTFEEIIPYVIVSAVVTILALMGSALVIRKKEL